MSDINLNQAQRSAVINLQESQKLADRTTLRLATGKKVNSIADDAVSYFRSRSLNERAQTLLSRKDDIGQALSTVQSSLEGINSIDTFLKQLKGVAESQRSSTQSERQAANNTFRNVLSQISQVVNDTTYGGLNLLKSSSTALNVRFSDLTSSSLSVSGFSFLSNTDSTTSTLRNNVFSKGSKIFADAVGTVNTIGNVLQGLGSTSLTSGFTQIGSNNSNSSEIDKVISTLDQAIYRVRGQASTFGAYGAILQTRSDFATNYAAKLQQGASELVNADLNEEGANLLAIQTRIQLGSNALQFATSTRNTVTRLLGA